MDRPDDRLIDSHHPIHDLFRRRWSPRAFDTERPVEPAKLRSCFEAARWAPSSNNEQPWSFIVATKNRPDEYARALSCLVERNQLWARHAPVLVIGVASLAFSRNRQRNRHAMYDLGAAVAFLTVEATAQGLSLHQMAGFLPDKARETYSIPESAEPVVEIALGYRGHPDSLPEDFRQRELTPTMRKPITEFVFEGKWGQPAGWANG
jgi:nitroreductase